MWVGASYRMVLSVLRRIHWGMGRFCFLALASLTLVRKLLWLCWSCRSAMVSPHVPRQSSGCSALPRIIDRSGVAASVCPVVAISIIALFGRGYHVPAF